MYCHQGGLGGEEDRIRDEETRKHHQVTNLSMSPGCYYYLCSQRGLRPLTRSPLLLYRPLTPPHLLRTEPDLPVRGTCNCSPDESLRQPGLVRPEIKPTDQRTVSSCSSVRTHLPTSLTPAGSSLMTFKPGALYKAINSRRERAGQAVPTKSKLAS